MKAMVLRSESSEAEPGWEVVDPACVCDAEGGPAAAEASGVATKDTHQCNTPHIVQDAAASDLPMRKRPQSISVADPSINTCGAEPSSADEQAWHLTLGPMDTDRLSRSSTMSFEQIMSEGSDMDYTHTEDHPSCNSPAPNAVGWALEQLADFAAEPDMMGFDGAVPVSFAAPDEPAADDLIHVSRSASVISDDDRYDGTGSTDHVAMPDDVPLPVYSTASGEDNSDDIDDMKTTYDRINPHGTGPEQACQHGAHSAAEGMLAAMHSSLPQVSPDSASTMIHVHSAGPQSGRDATAAEGMPSSATVPPDNVIVPYYLALAAELPVADVTADSRDVNSSQKPVGSQANESLPVPEYADTAMEGVDQGLAETPCPDMDLNPSYIAGQQGLHEDWAAKYDGSSYNATAAADLPPANSHILDNSLPWQLVDSPTEQHWHVSATIQLDPAPDESPVQLLLSHHDAMMADMADESLLQVVLTQRHDVADSPLQLLISHKGVLTHSDRQSCHAFGSMDSVQVSTY